MIRFLSYVIKLTKFNRYYYFKNNKFEEITIIILFLNLFLFSNKIKNYIFHNNIYVVNENKIYKLDVNSNNVIKTKIIRSLTYKDKYYKIDLSKIRNKIYLINDNISIDFILKYFYNIDRHNDSCIIIDYFRNSTKILKINFTSTTKDLY